MNDIKVVFVKPRVPHHEVNRVIDVLRNQECFDTRVVFRVRPYMKADIYFIPCDRNGVLASRYVPKNSTSTINVYGKNEQNHDAILKNNPDVIPIDIKKLL